MSTRSAQRQDSYASTSSSMSSQTLYHVRREVAGISILSATSVLVLIFLVWACVTRGERAHAGSNTCDSRKNEKGFNGNDDLYGLGIRLGIYCQWFASLIANTLSNEEVRKTTTTPYLGFQIAMLAALLMLVFRSDCTFTVEVIVVLYILLGGVFIVLAPEIVQSFRHLRWREAQAPPKYRLFNTFVWIVIGWVAPVSAWFWIRLATDRLGKTDFYSTPGGTSMFFLSHIKESHIETAGILLALWSIVLGLFALEKIVFASLYKALDLELRPVVFILLDVFCRMAFVVLDLLKLAGSQVMSSYRDDSTRSTWQHLCKCLDIQISLSVGDISRRGSTRRPEAYTKLYVMLLATFNIVLSVYAVELTLLWNHVSGINSVASTGQIVPLLVGVVTLVTVLWELFKEFRARFDVARSQANHDNACGPYDVESSMWQQVNWDKA